MKSSQLFKSAVPNKLELTATHSGDGTATAFLYGDVIEVNCVDVGSSETVTVATPFKFEVVDYFMRVTNGQNVTDKTMTLKNGSTAISSALAASTDKGFVRPTTMDSAQATFEGGDDDLVLASSAHGDGDQVHYLKIIVK